MKVIILLRHHGFMDRFIRCPFAEAKKPLGYSLNWWSGELAGARFFTEKQAAKEVVQYRAELEPHGYRLSICRLVTRRVLDYEII